MSEGKKRLEDIGRLYESEFGEIVAGFPIPDPLLRSYMYNDMKQKNNKQRDGKNCFVAGGERAVESRN